METRTQGMTLNPPPIALRILYRIFPAMGREHKRLQERSRSFNISIQTYSETTCQVQKVIDDNHFNPYLEYEKAEK